MFELAFVPKAEERPEHKPRLLWVVYGLCVLMLLYQLYDGWMGRQVSSRQPIGSVVKVTGEGRKWLVETETGFYPVRKALMVNKGTPLVLEIRGNGDRYVCNSAVTAEHCYVVSATVPQKFEEAMLRWTRLGHKGGALVELRAKVAQQDRGCRRTTALTKVKGVVVSAEAEGHSIFNCRRVLLCNLDLHSPS